MSYVQYKHRMGDRVDFFGDPGRITHSVNEHKLVTATMSKAEGKFYIQLDELNRVSSIRFSGFGPTVQLRQDVTYEMGVSSLRHKFVEVSKHELKKMPKKPIFSRAILNQLTALYPGILKKE